MSLIAENIERIKSQLPDGVKLVAVSKFHPLEQVQEAYATGQRIFGESHAQELVVKAPAMPDDVEWHFIGHLQRNKVRAVVPHVTMIQSVDSMRLLEAIEKEAARIAKTVDVLLQLHVAQEEAKSGFSIEELLAAAREGQFKGFEHVRFRGLMAMATFTDVMTQVDREFASVHKCFETLRSESLFNNELFTEISMGMSDDWPVAVKNGATLVRIGTDIFGPRQY